MLWAHEDISTVPGATKRTDKSSAAWEFELEGYPVQIITGAWHWRVVVCDPKTFDVLLITPHVFHSAKDAYEWLEGWFDGYGMLLWRPSWGVRPSWNPQRADRGQINHGQICHEQISHNQN